MCGRIFQTHDLNRLIRISRAGRVQNSGRFRTHYNMGPKNYLSTVRNIRNISNKQNNNESKAVEDQVKPSNDLNSNKKRENVDNKDSNDSSKKNDLTDIEKAEAKNYIDTHENSLDQKETFDLPKNDNTSSIPDKTDKDSNFESKNKLDDLVQFETIPDRELDFLNWGHTTPNFFVINARIEELPEKEMFKYIVNANRCAVIVEGFYEWNPNKQAFSFINKIDNYFFIAALYTKENNIILLTKEAPKKLSVVHHRMPVLLEEKELDIWLDVKNYKFNNILDKYIINEENAIWNKVEFQMVAPYVSSVQNNTKLCLMSKKEYLEKNGIEKFFVKKVKSSEKTEQKMVVNDKSEENKKEQKDLEVACDSKKIEKKKLELEPNEETKLIPSKKIK